MQVAFPLLAIGLTRSPLLIAGVAVAGRLPWLLVSLPAGALADRMDRRRLVVTVEIIRALVLLCLTVIVLTDHATLLFLYLAAFAIGALETAFSAATRAAVPALVNDVDLPRANGYLQAAETSGRQFAGPALGGFLFSWSAAVPFLGDALSFAGSAALLGKALPAKDADVEPAPRKGLGADVVESLRWLRSQPLLRSLALAVTTFAFCQSAVLSVLVIYGVQNLDLSKQGFGLFLGVGAIGDVVGSLLAHRAHRRLGPARAIIAAVVAAAAGYLILAATASIVLAVLAYALEATAVALGNVATMSLRQRMIPSAMFGRVNNAFRMCVFGVVPVGALASGLFTARYGVRSTFVAAGIIQLALAALLGPRLFIQIRDRSAAAA